MCRIAMSDNKIAAMKNKFIIAVIMMILCYYYAVSIVHIYGLHWYVYNICIHKI